MKTKGNLYTNETICLFIFTERSKSWLNIYYFMTYRPSSKFFLVDWYFRFMIINTENVISQQYIPQNNRLMLRNTSEIGRYSILTTSQHLFNNFLWHSSQQLKYQSLKSSILRQYNPKIERDGSRKILKVVFFKLLCFQKRRKLSTIKLLHYKDSTLELELRYAKQYLLTLHDIIAHTVQNVCVMCSDEGCVKLHNPTWVRAGENTLDSLHIWFFNSFLAIACPETLFCWHFFHGSSHCVTQGWVGWQLTAREVGL